MKYRVPLINWIDPVKEQPAARHICAQLRQLHVQVGHFERAVELADYCEDLLNTGGNSDAKRPIDWMALAARDAAFTVYHFQSVVRSIRDQLHRAPSLQRKVDTKALEAAYRRIDDEIPAWKAMRHAVGHLADMRFRLEDVDRHNLPDGLNIQNAFKVSTRELFMTRNGKWMSLSLTHATLCALEDIMLDVFAAFAKAAVQWRRD